MRVSNERSGREFECWFEATPGVPTAPTTVHWKLDCVTTRKSLSEFAELTPEILSDETGITGCKVVIDVPGSLLAIQNDNNVREVKHLLVVADKDTDREYSKDVEFYVRNVPGRV
jgi:hypothetical protein